MTNLSAPIVHGRLLGLDLGDVWIGIAISDPQGILARPLATVRKKQLITQLVELVSQYDIQGIVAGLPITLQGTHSAQTKTVDQEIAALQNQFPGLPVISWDERLSSKRASALKPSSNKQVTDHARAAAFILDSYLNYKRLHDPLTQD